MVRFESVRTLLALAAQRDVKWIHGKLVYMNQHEGFVESGYFVCKLNRIIYGLKQSPRLSTI